MSYNGPTNTGILGYSVYNNGKMIKENICFTDTQDFYRKINGTTYNEHKNCQRWSDECNKDCKKWYYI